MRQYLDQEDIPNILLTADVFLDSAFSIFLGDKKIQIEVPKI